MLIILNRIENNVYCILVIVEYNGYMRSRGGMEREKYCTKINYYPIILFVIIDVEYTLIYQ